MQSMGTERSSRYHRLALTQRMKDEAGRWEMQIRQVKWVGGGERGLGLRFGLRLGYQGSRRLRRFVVRCRLGVVLGMGGRVVWRVELWERRTRVGAATGRGILRS